MMDSIYWINLVILGVASFLQNMAFTWTSRSRNSGDPSYHRYAALCSNGIWFVCNFLILKQVWAVFDTGNFWALGPVCVVYVVATTEGSVLMMQILLKKEQGKRQVGAR